MKNIAPIAEYITNELDTRCIPIVCDCTSEQDIAKAFRAVHEQAGEVDVLCYNAGYEARPRTAEEEEAMEPGLGSGGAVELITANEAEMAYKLHVGGLMLCAQQVKNGTKYVHVISV